MPVHPAAGTTLCFYRFSPRRPRDHRVCEAATGGGRGVAPDGFCPLAATAQARSSHRKRSTAIPIVSRWRRTSHPRRFATSTTPTSIATWIVRRMIDSKSTLPSSPRWQRCSMASAWGLLGQPLLTIRPAHARFLPTQLFPHRCRARPGSPGASRGNERGSRVPSETVEKTGSCMSENSLTLEKAVAIILSVCSLIEPAWAWRELTASPDTAFELCRRVPLV